MPEETLGHFEILGEVGAGGMGVVLRARDPRLDREVAIKTLPPHVAESREHLERLQREARMLAALSHPNIAAIHGLERDGERRFLVLELIEGESLADRLRRGRRPIAEALELADQIAAGLAAAHDRGVVHRDLKPGNIMVRPDGQVKILDFGLAKTLQVDPEPLSDSPTVPADLTATGAVLGTPGYMSPEQARGEAAGRRADVWAFGCVLYELLAGRAPFPGGSAAERVGRLLTAEPDWEALPADTPVAVRRLLARTLAKDPGARLRDLHDARLELAEARGAGVSEGSPGAAAKGPPGRLVQWLVTALAVLGAVALWALVGRRPAEPPLRETVRSEIVLDTGTRLVIGGRSLPLALSPDGRRLVYAAHSGGVNRLYLRELGSFETRPLGGTDGARNPFFSPDGEWVAFFAADQLRKVSLAGGTPLPLCDTPLDSLGGAWGEDGTIVYAEYASGLWAVSSEGGDPRPLTAPDPDQRVLQHRWPQILPGGRHVLFTIQTPEGPRLATMPLEGGTPQLVPGVGAVARGRYLPSGHLVLAQAQGLMAARFDPAARRLLETPVEIFTWEVSSPDLRVANFALADDGTLAYLTGISSSGGRLVWVDRDGGETPITNDVAAYENPKLSPGDDQLYYQIGSEVSGRRGWLLDLERRTNEVLVQAEFGNAVWLPDSLSLIGSSSRSGVWNLYRVTLEGEMTAIHPGELEQWVGSTSSDGRTLAYYVIHPQRARDILSLRLDDPDREPLPLIVTDANERAPQISPNDAWLAFVSDQSGRDEIYLTTFPRPGRHWLISRDGGREPLWSEDGRTLYYREGDAILGLRIGPPPDPSPGAARVILRGDFAREVAGNPNYDVSGDDRRFVLIKRPFGDDARRIRLVTGWLDEMRQRLAERP